MTLADELRVLACKSAFDHDELRALADRAEAIEKDAERYRFIRRGDRGTYDHVLIYTDGTLDRTVDAAIAKEPKP